jgi:hypothetical protein
MKNDYAAAHGVAIVRLTQGQSMFAAEDALPLLAPHRWHAHRHGKTFYAVTKVQLPDGYRSSLYAHRLLVGLGHGDQREVDHVDGNGLNNLPFNLRVTDSTGNAHNEHGKRRRLGKATSHFSGVYWNIGKLKWRAQIRLARRRIHLGYYDAENDARDAYLRAKAARDAEETT